jgi:hypothetical protein
VLSDGGQIATIEQEPVIEKAEIKVEENLTPAAEKKATPPLEDRQEEKIVFSDNSNLDDYVIGKQIG